MSIIGTCPRSFCRMSIHLCPCLGIGAAYPGQSLPTYSSMVASVHRLQLVHSATSMMRFHFCIGLPAESALPPPCGGGLGWGVVAVVHNRTTPTLTPPHKGEGNRNAIHYHLAGTRLAALSVSWISRSFAIAANVADMCSMRRSHGSICTSELAPASEWVDFVWVRSGVSRLRQPPRSTDLPGSPIGSYSADDS